MVPVRVQSWRSTLSMNCKERLIGDPANHTSEELALTGEILERLTRRIDNAARKAVMNKRGGTPYKQFGVPRSKTRTGE